VFFLTLGQIPVFGIWSLMAGRAVDAAGAYALVAGTSILLNLVANVAYVEALRTGEISRTVPLLSLTPAFTAVFAIPVLGEVPAGREALGILLVVAGAWLLSVQRGGVPGGRPLALMLVVIAAWSAVLPLDKLGMELAGPAIHGLVLSAGIMAGVGAVLLGRGQARRLTLLPRPARAPLAGAVLVGAAALATQLLALGLVPAALVETVKRAIGNVLALVWGRSLFREAVTLRKAVALVLLVLGVVLVLS
jgi:uncharacterized membrane protein